MSNLTANQWNEGIAAAKRLPGEIRAAQVHFDKLCTEDAKAAITALKKIDKDSKAGKAVAGKVADAIKALESLPVTFFTMAKGCGAGISQLEQYKENCQNALAKLKSESEGKEGESEQKD